MLLDDYWWFGSFGDYRHHTPAECISAIASALFEPPLPKTCTLTIRNPVLAYLFKHVLAALCQVVEIHQIPPRPYTLGVFNVKIMISQ